MADNDNVIPFAPRSKSRGTRRTDSEGEGAGKRGGPSRKSGSPDKGGEPAGEEERPLHGRLVWLHCPTCGTLEYSEVLLPGGRTHKCGTVVQEQEVDLDLRAEYSLAGYNLERLQQMAHLVEAQKARFEEYQRRLLLAAREPIESYELTQERLSTLPVAAMDPAGALISPFLHDPIKRFPPETRGGATLDEEARTREPGEPGDAPEAAPAEDDGGDDRTP